MSPNACSRLMGEGAEKMRPKIATGRDIRIPWARHASENGVSDSGLLGDFPGVHSSVQLGLRGPVLRALASERGLTLCWLLGLPE